MKRIELLKRWTAHEAGTVLEVESVVADRLVRSGFAREVVKRGPKPSRTKVSTAGATK